MDHVAIDLGGRESQLCVRRANGTIVEERRVLTRQLPKVLAALPPSQVIVETCAEAFAIADAARAAQHDVCVVPATLVKTLGVGARGVKTDRRDAQVLSEVSSRIVLPSVHIPSLQARELKSLTGARELLIETRTAFINNVRGWLGPSSGGSGPAHRRASPTECAATRRRCRRRCRRTSNANS